MPALLSIKTDGRRARMGWQTLGQRQRHRGRPERSESGGIAFDDRGSLEKIIH